MSNERISNIFIQNVADSIRDLIKLQVFYQSIFQYLQETGLFPPDVDEQILEHLFSQGNQSNQIINDYMSIINRHNDQELYQLHFEIFSEKKMNHSSSASSFNIGEDEDEDINFDDENYNNNIEIMVPIAKCNPIDSTLTLAQLGELQEKTIIQIARRFNIHPEIAEILYQLFNFDENKVLQELTSNISKCRELIGLNDQDLALPIHFKKHKKKSDNETCLICLDDEDNGLDLYSLPCKHYFCKDCIRDHIKFQVAACKYEISCPDSSCKCRIVQKDIQKFCGPEIAHKYFNTIIESQINLNPNLHHCARESCPSILSISSVGLGNVATCNSCGCQMCWKCKSKSHAPLDCDLVPKWLEISKEENAELKWIKENTKECPKCHERIERNGGCTYIKCIKCQYEFCFVCGGPFPAHKNHNANCTVYRDYDTLKMPSNVDVGRLSFYLTRFLSNKVSHENEIKQRDKRQNELLNIFVYYYDIPSERLKMVDAMKLTNDIFSTIDEARSVLIWSYPHAFFMQPGSQKLKLFEYVQQDLNVSLEELANLVENNQFESPENFRKAMNKVRSYTKSVMLHVYS